MAGNKVRARAGWRTGISRALLIGGCLLAGGACAEEPLDAPWQAGSQDCAKAPVPALEVHHFDPHTLILRESLCLTARAPFLYLLAGTQKALLIDTGDVPEPGRLALAAAVRRLMPAAPDGAPLPLLVVHTGQHPDHHAGDAQLRQIPGVTVVDAGLDSVTRYFDLPQWPLGTGHIDLGQRAVDVIPTPGPDAAGLTFYDRGSALAFTGDFLLPGRIQVEDIGAYQDSARRLTSWLSNRPLTAFLGGRIEMDGQGRLFPSDSRHHPGERFLPMDPSGLPALSQALDRFNGLSTRAGGFTVENPVRLRLLWLLGGAVLLAVLLWFTVSRLRSARSARAAGAQPG